MVMDVILEAVHKASQSIGQDRYLIKDASNYILQQNKIIPVPFYFKTGMIKRYKRKAYPKFKSEWNKQNEDTID